tara:strand:+ start:49 stop:561 length:513 start_codon:yes stop_codon:yes gene_type:complete
MKTFKQFQEEIQYLDELAPLIPAALSLGGKALAAYSAYSAAKNLAKGKYKQAGLDAMGVVPGGKVFKGMRALGAGRKFAKAGEIAQSVNRLNITGKTPNAYARGLDKVTQKGFNLVTSPFKGKTANAANAKTVNTKTNVNNKPKVGGGGARYDRAGNEYSRSGKLKLANT